MGRGALTRAIPSLGLQVCDLGRTRNARKTLNTFARNTARERVEACIARIEAEEPQLQAFVRWDAAQARAEAADIDKRRPEAPLAGLMMGV